MNLLQMCSEGLICEEGLGAALGRAGEGSFVVVHPKMPFEPRFLDESFCAVATLERFLKRQVATVDAGTVVAVSLKRNGHHMVNTYLVQLSTIIV